MSFVLPNILTATTLDQIRRLAESSTLVDGIKTANGSVKNARYNNEISWSTNTARAKNTRIEQALASSIDFKVIATPRHLSPFLVRPYTSGTRYNDHFDNAVLSNDGGQLSDMLLAISLNDPEEYAGGALALSTELNPERYKLPTGHCVIHPTHFLYQMEEVTRGTRLVSVGWIHGRDRDPLQRQTLIDLAISLSLFPNSML